MRTDIPFPNGDLPALLKYPVNLIEQMPACLILHGFVSCKEGDNGMHNLIANMLNELGMVTLQFDFCSCGENANHKSNYTVNQMMEEAIYVYEYLCSLDSVDGNNVLVIGHSFGCRVTSSILDRINPRGIITLNGALGDKYRIPCWFKSEMDRIQKECRTLGKSEFIDSLGNKQEIYQKFLVELEQSDAVSLIKKYNNQLLVIYGSDDPTVDPNVSIKFYESASTTNKKLVCIEGANHTFNIKTNDWTKMYECIEVIRKWLVDYYL